KLASQQPDEGRKKYYGADIRQNRNTTGQTRNDRARKKKGQEENNPKKDVQNYWTRSREHQSRDIEECFASQAAAAVHDGDHELHHNGDEDHATNPDQGKEH